MEPRTGDAFGAALLEHHGGGTGDHLIERDDGWVECASSAPYFGDASTWTAGEAAVLDRVGSSVLDVGAGAGRTSLALQTAGIDVTALDVSPGAVEVCRSRGVASTHLGDIHSLEDDGFDSFVFFGNNLGLLGGPEAAHHLLDRVRALAAPGARVFGSTLDPYETTDPDHLAYHRLNNGRGRHAGEITIRIRHRELATPWIDLWWTSLDELESAVVGAGWLLEDAIADGPFRTVVLAMS